MARYRLSIDRSTWLPTRFKRLLSQSARYRAWARRQPADFYDEPEHAKLPEYPRWRLAAGTGGWETLYTTLGERRFRLSLWRETHLVPPFHVDLEEWQADVYGHNYLPFMPSGCTARHWGSIHEVYLPTLEAAEAEYARLKTGLEEFLMEQTL